MKTIKPLLFTVALFSTQTFAQDITFAMEATYPPFESTNEAGEIIGFDVDIANAICKELNASCHFKHEAFDSLIPNLISHRGGFDAAISAIDITEARAKKVAFSVPYYDSSAAFIALENKTMDEVKTVGVQNGSTYKQYIAKHDDKFKANSYPSIQGAVLDLKTGRVDAVFGDTAVLAESVKNEKGLNFIGKKVTDPVYFGHGFGIAVNKKNKDLLNQFNQALAALKANGEYQKIYDKWFAK